MTLVWAHLVATLALVGLIWTVQLVHYPLFAEVGEANWARYHALHNVWITRLVGPLMFVEAGTAALLLLRRPEGVHLGLLVVGAALLAVVWGTTAFVSVPRHARLAEGFDLETIRSLVSTNWIRTFAWSLRGAVAVALVAQTLPAAPSA